MGRPMVKWATTCMSAGERRSAEASQRTKSFLFHPSARSAHIRVIPPF